MDVESGGDDNCAQTRAPTRRVVADELEGFVEHADVGNDDTHLSVFLHELLEFFAASRSGGQRPALDEIVARVQAAVVVEADFDAFDERHNAVGKLRRF